MKSREILLRSFFLFMILFSASLTMPADTSQVAQGGVSLGPEFKIIDKWQGTWDVKATRRQPPPIQEVIYVETFDWILNGRYLRSETSRKSDGGKSMSMFWFDTLTKTYRFVVYDASGLAVELPPPTWADSTQTMEWKSGLLAPASYAGYATFKDRDTIQWKSQWKDWKGTVILDIEGTSIRRK